MGRDTVFLDKWFVGEAMDVRGTRLPREKVGVLGCTIVGEGKGLTCEVWPRGLSFERISMRRVRGRMRATGNVIIRIWCFCELTLLFRTSVLDNYSQSRELRCTGLK